MIYAQVIFSFMVIKVPIFANVLFTPNPLDKTMSSNTENSWHSVETWGFFLTTLTFSLLNYLVLVWNQDQGSIDLKEDDSGKDDLERLRIEFAKCMRRLDGPRRKKRSVFPLS
jgi:hypothetical protein